MTVNRQATDRQPTPNKNERIKESKNDKNNIYCAEFEKFWNAYPNHKAKSKAAAAFDKFIKGKVDIDLIISAVEAQKNTDQWKRDNGQYIPYPATWINQRRWEDELPTSTKPNDANSRGDRTAEVEEMLEELKRMRLIG